MAQAKTLNKTELKQLLDVTNSCSRYPLRDSTMLLFTHLCGLRVGEVAALRVRRLLRAYLFSFGNHIRNCQYAPRL